jgi:hypothetical protein
MSIQDLGALGDLIAAIGVVASLFYLALQIRQNTRQIDENIKASKAAAVNTSLQLISDNRIAIYSDEGTARIWHRGLNDPCSLDALEKLRFRVIFSNVMDALFNTYSLTKATNFSPETWAAQVATVRRIIRTKGGEWFWDQYQHEYRQDFRGEILRILTHDPPVDG